MQTLTLECEGRIALCPVTSEEITSFGAVREDLEGFVEQMRRIKGVRVAVLIRQDPGRRCKLSLRSSGKDDVRSVAAVFGVGGGRDAGDGRGPGDAHRAVFQRGRGHHRRSGPLRSHPADHHGHTGSNAGGIKNLRHILF